MQEGVPPRRPTQYAGCYSLDLYCDKAGRRGGDERHGYGQFPHQFIGETFGECARQALSRGWIIHRKTRTATCPKCSGKPAKKDEQ